MNVDTYRRQAEEHKAAGAQSMWITVDDLLALLDAPPATGGLPLASAEADGLDVERLARADYDVEPECVGLGMGPAIPWDELSESNRKQRIERAAAIAAAYAATLAGGEAS